TISSKHRICCSRATRLFEAWFSLLSGSKFCRVETQVPTFTRRLYVADLNGSLCLWCQQRERMDMANELVQTDGTREVGVARRALDSRNVCRTTGARWPQPRAV